MSSGLPDHLRLLLKRVSRSFYLSVRVLPTPVRAQVATGYLLARAADTIADTVLLPPDERLRSLADLRRCVQGDAAARAELLPRLKRPKEGAFDGAEAKLLAVLDECLACFDALSDGDRPRVAHVLEQLITGMERDLSRFPAPEDVTRAVLPSHVVALRNRAELDEYTYFAAGCVGEFWTDLMAAHIASLRLLRQPELHVRGVALGKALQMVNVVRDVAADLRAGRCYWPIDMLDEHGLTPQQLAEIFAKPEDRVTAAERAALESLTATLLELSQELVAIARPYVDAIPKSELRVKLACAWPLQLADETLQALRLHKTPLGRPIKVPRRQVYRLLLRSTATAAADLLRASLTA